MALSWPYRARGFPVDWRIPGDQRRSIITKILSPIRDQFLDSPWCLSSLYHSFSNCNRHSPATPSKNKGRREKIGHRVVATRTRTAKANNDRTGHSLARLVNFISLGGQALNFGTSIIALRFVLQPFPLCARSRLARPSARRDALYPPSIWRIPFRVARDDDRFVFLDVWSLRGDDTVEFFTGKMPPCPINTAMNATTIVNRKIYVYFEIVRKAKYVARKFSITGVVSVMDESWQMSKHWELRKYKYSRTLIIKISNNGKLINFLQERLESKNRKWSVIFCGKKFDCLFILCSSIYSNTPPTSLLLPNYVLIRIKINLTRILFSNTLLGRDVYNSNSESDKR